MTQTPSKFTLNSDYLSIAQTGKYTFTYAVAPETVPAGGQVIKGTDFTIPSQKGAIDQIMIKRDTGDYKIGQVYSIDVAPSGAADLTVYRTSATNLHADYVVSNLTGSSSITSPAMLYTIKVNTFKPPNVF